MEQYSPKNQIFLTAQAAERGMPQPTDVRSCKAWNAAGRSIIKGEKALRVWIPKRGKAIPADRQLTHHPRGRFTPGRTTDKESHPMTYQWTVTFTADHDPILDGYECVSHADSMIAALIMRTRQSDFGLILGPIQES